MTGAAGGKQIGDLLIETALAQPDFPDFLEQPLEIVFAQERAILHALTIKHIAGNGILLQHLRSPAAELGGTNGIDAVAN